MTGTRIRPLTRLLDASDAAMWAISPAGRLVYLSAGMERWLGVDPESLLDRRCVAGSPVSDDPLDIMAAQLSAPPGLGSRGTASLRITPPSENRPSENRPSENRPCEHSASEPTEVRFIRVGEAEHAWVLAVAGGFDDRITDGEVQDAVAIRQRLDVWRKQTARRAALVTVGDSRSAGRLRHRLHVASLARTDVLLVGGRGCGSDRIASGLSLAPLSSTLPSPEPSVTIDGPLMDPELLDATLSPVTDTLAEAIPSQATAIIRDFEKMPLDAQDRLVFWHHQFEGRLRLVGLTTTTRPPTASKETGKDLRETDLAWPDDELEGISAALADVFCACIIPIDALRERVEDIPAMATALLDAWRGADATKAERISRAAIDALVIYPWPDEFNELDHSIRHAAHSATGPLIAPENLPLAIRSYRPGNPIAQAKRTPVPLDQAIRKYERELIQSALESADGNRAEAARRLGISRARLLRKLDDSQ